MIMSFVYQLDLGDRDAEDLALKIRNLAGRLLPRHPYLRGLRVTPEPGKLTLTLRIAGLTRWHVQRDAPRLLNIFLRKFKIPVTAATFQSLEMEPGRSWLRDGKGRTAMTRRPRAERMADGRPWDHIAWEGDDVGEVNVS